MKTEITKEFRAKIKNVLSINEKLNVSKIATSIDINKSTLGRIINGESQTMEFFAYSRLDYFLNNHWALSGQSELAPIISNEQSMLNFALNKVIENWQNRVDSLDELIRQKDFQLETFELELKEKDKIIKKSNSKINRMINIGQEVI